MSKKSQEHPCIRALNGGVLRTKHDALLSDLKQRIPRLMLTN
jgi:hypothetical protein